MKALIVSICLLFVGCSMVDVSEHTPLKGMSVGEAWFWIDKNIEFKSDFIDDFQLPETTYRLRTGDCEDFCILLMSVMNEQGPAPELVCINQNGSWHYIVSRGNVYYEAQTFGKFYDKQYVTDNFLWSYTYQDAFSMSM
jgi:hypothetical protein